MSTKLYYLPGSPNSRKVVATVHELGATHIELQAVDFNSPTFDEQALLRVNPNGLTPALEDGAFKLWESNAIMQYLADTQNSTLFPKDPTVRADITRWQFWDMAHFGRACVMLSFENVFKKMFGMGEPDATEVRENLEYFRTHAPVLNDQLSIRKYVTGNELTLADFTLASSLMYATPAGIPVAEFPHIVRWFADMEKTKGWKNSTPPAHR